MLTKILDSSKYVSINYDMLDNIINNSDFNNLKHWLNSNPFNVGRMAKGRNNIYWF